MKQICIQLTDEQHHKLTKKLQEEGKRNFENETFSGFSITLEEAFPGIISLMVNMNGELDLGAVKWEII